jgi:hypothetical protein
MSEAEIYQVMGELKSIGAQNREQAKELLLQFPALSLACVRMLDNLKQFKAGGGKPGMGGPGGGGMGMGMVMGMGMGGPQRGGPMGGPMGGQMGGPGGPPGMGGPGGMGPPGLIPPRHLARSPGPLRRARAALFARLPPRAFVRAPLTLSRLPQVGWARLGWGAHPAWALPA